MMLIGFGAIAREVLDGALVSLYLVLIFAQDDRPHGITLKIEGKTESIAGKFEHLTLHHIGEPMDSHDSIGN